MESTAQEGGEVTIPGGVQEMFRCCIEGSGLVGNNGDRWTVGLDDLRGLVGDSMILKYRQLNFKKTFILFRVVLSELLLTHY